MFHHSMKDKKRVIQQYVDEISTNHFEKSVVPANIAKLSKDHKFLSLKKQFEDQRKKQRTVIVPPPPPEPI